MIRFTLLVSGLMICLIGCGDYAIELPNGYSLVRVSADPLVLANPSRQVVVAPSGTHYAVQGDLVVGAVSPHAEGSPPATPAGYFLIDTAEGSVMAGLTQQQLISELRRRNVDLPRLREPRRRQS